MRSAISLLFSVSFLILIQSCADLGIPERHLIDTSVLPGEYKGDLQLVIDQVNYLDPDHVLTIKEGGTDYWFMSFDSIHTLDSTYIIDDIKFEIDQYRYLDNHQIANIIITGNQDFTGIEPGSNWDAVNTLGLDYRLTPREIGFNIGLESIQNTEDGISQIRIHAKRIF
jgi:hypothetical protein